MKNHHLFCTLALPLLQSATAATLTAPGAELNQPSWRTSTVAKTRDINGDNIYGTDGYLLPRFGLTTGSTVDFSTVNGTDGTLNTLPSYFVVTTSGSPTGADKMYPQKLAIDNPNDVAGPDVPSGVAFAVSARGPGYANFLNFTMGTGVPLSTMRIGILAGTSPGGDFPNGVSLTQTIGSGTGTQNYTITPGSASANWYFFDVTGAMAGDVFTLALSASGSNVKPTISGVTLDVVPEPSGLALFSLGAGLMLLRRRRA